MALVYPHFNSIMNYQRQDLYLQLYQDSHLGFLIVSLFVNLHLELLKDSLVVLDHLFYYFNLHFHFVLATNFIYLCRVAILIFALFDYILNSPYYQPIHYFSHFINHHLISICLNLNFIKFNSTPLFLDY